jgi:drug/metabolite transporter (DMT)-like permease
VRAADAPAVYSTSMHAPNVPTSAMLLIVGSTLCFSLLDTIVKYLAPHYPVPLLVWARWTFQAVAIAAWLGPRMRRALVRTPRPGLQIVRGLVIVLSALLFMTALKYMPLAEATALNYSSPVVVVVMAVLLLGERMTRTRVAFVVAGIAGMLLIVRPGTEIFRGASLLALCAAAVYATYQILTRMVADEDSRVTLFYPSLVCAAVMTASLPLLDIAPRMPVFDGALICAAGLLGTLGHFLFILAFQRAPASALTPFTYMQLVWAMLIGWIVFGEFPDGWALAGMLVIAGSGLLMAVYERQRLRSRVPVRLVEPAAID